jgi:hypothetical protein
VLRRTCIVEAIHEFAGRRSICTGSGRQGQLILRKSCTQGSFGIEGKSKGDSIDIRLLQRGESPLYIHVQEARVSRRELTSSLLASAKLIVTHCREGGFGEVGCDEVCEAAKPRSRTSAKCGQAKCEKMRPAEVRPRRGTMSWMESRVTRAELTREELKQRQVMLMCMRYYHRLAITWLCQSCINTASPPHEVDSAHAVEVKNGVCWTIARYRWVVEV